MEKRLEELKILIGRRIKFYRLRKDMTLMELAEKIGYKSSGALSDVENGKKALANDKLQSMAEVLDVPVALLVTPFNYDDTDEKASLVADLLELMSKGKDVPALSAIHAIITAELSKK